MQAIRLHHGGGVPDLGKQSMRTIREIISDIESLNLQGNNHQYVPLLNRIANEVESHPDGVQAIRQILILHEKHPAFHFGMPGPLTHSIESYYGRGYEDALIESLQRNPTAHTLWLANRIINANDGNSARFLAVLQEVTQRTDISEILKNEAFDFLQDHA